jgi:hypothetical protein
MINAQLVQGGVNVFYLGLGKPSLEDIFLSLTQEPKVWEESDEGNDTRT